MQNGSRKSVFVKFQREKTFLVIYSLKRLHFLSQNFTNYCFSIHFAKYQKFEKCEFFSKNHALTLWEKFKFWDLFKSMFLESKRASFSFQIVTTSSKSILYQNNTWKNRIKKGSKICLFPRGSIHGFCQKIAIFPTIVFMQNGQRRSSW